MDNHDVICVKLTAGGDCDTAAPWDPNLSGMFVFASGDFATELSTDSGTAGNGIEIKKGQYQGGLFAANKIDASVTGTVVQGPMVSAYATSRPGRVASSASRRSRSPRRARADSPGRSLCRDCSPPATSVEAEMRTYELSRATRRPKGFSWS